jgi:hypothetical protein
MMARFYCCSVKDCDYAFWTSATTFSPSVCTVHDALLVRGPESRPENLSAAQKRLDALR